MIKPEKIISGGQTGADQAGLDAAILLGIPTGGTAPKGCLIQDEHGNDISCPELVTKYGLKEHHLAGYPHRTIQNVADSYGTVWVGYDRSPGGKLTIKTCKEMARPYIVNPSPEQLRLFVTQYNVKVLNVAGNRQSVTNPNIYDRTFSLIYSAFNL